MPPTRFILNPISGGAKVGRLRQARLANYLRARRLDAEVALTQGPRHATELAAEAVAKGYGLVVAVGGDGTLNEVAQALVHQPVDFGLVPCGSGNGFARHLGIPLGFEAALDHLLAAPARLVDTATANGVPFFNVFGTGLDAQVAQAFNQSPMRGPLPYFWLGLQTWLGHRPQPYELTLDGRPTQKLEAALVCVANISQYGNNARIAPAADVADGLLDVVVVQKPNLAQALFMARHLFAGSLLEHPLVAHQRAKSVRLALPTGAPAHTDGELHPFGAEVAIECLPQSLRVRG
jgi:YegS/Rv2252/BmrU family lipid kinase